MQVPWMPLILIASPVLGLWPVRAALFLASKVGDKEFHTIVKATRKTLGIQGVGEQTGIIICNYAFCHGKHTGRGLPRCFLNSFD